MFLKWFLSFELNMSSVCLSVTDWALLLWDSFNMAPRCSTRWESSLSSQLRQSFRFELSQFWITVEIATPSSGHPHSMQINIEINRKQSTTCFAFRWTRFRFNQFLVVKKMFSFIKWHAYTGVDTHRTQCPWHVRMAQIKRASNTWTYEYWKRNVCFPFPLRVCVWEWWSKREKEWKTEKEPKRRALKMKMHDKSSRVTQTLNAMDFPSTVWTLSFTVRICGVLLTVSQ